MVFQFGRFDVRAPKGPIFVIMDFFPENIQHLKNGKKTFGNLFFLFEIQFELNFDKVLEGNVHIHFHLPYFAVE